jgi:hypothetical protein
MATAQMPTFRRPRWANILTRYWPTYRSGPVRLTDCDRPELSAKRLLAAVETVDEQVELVLAAMLDQCRGRFGDVLRD